MAPGAYGGGRPPRRGPRIRVELVPMPAGARRARRAAPKNTRRPDLASGPPPRRPIEMTIRPAWLAPVEAVDLPRSGPVVGRPLARATPQRAPRRRLAQPVTEPPRSIVRQASNRARRGASPAALPNRRSKSTLTPRPMAGTDPRALEGRFRNLELD